MEHGRLAANTISFEAAYKLLIGDDKTEHLHRPYRIQSMPTRQIFIERPPARRQWGGGDKWRNSGGQRGGAIVWITPRRGVRKRYGVLVREEGRSKLKFQQFSLMTRKSQSPSAPVVEDPSVYLYIVEGCELSEAEDEIQDHGVKVVKQELTTTTAAPSALHQVVSAVQRPDVSRQTTTLGHSTHKPVVLNFASIAGKGKGRLKRPRSPETLETMLHMGLEPQEYKPASRRPRAWPFGKATVAAVSLLLISMVAFVGLIHLRPVEIAADSKCPMGEYRVPRSQLLPVSRCLRCTICIAHGQEMLRPCTTESDTVCGSWVWTRSTADVHISPLTTTPAVGSGFVVQPSNPSKLAYTYPESFQTSERQHLPQFSATWAWQGILYSFGGSGDTAAANTTQARLWTAGESCVTQATGVTDELWTYEPAEGWNQIGKEDRLPNDERDRPQSPVVWPRRRYAATSWGLEDGRGMIFSGDFEFCQNQDYLKYNAQSVSGKVFLPPDSLYSYSIGASDEPSKERGWSLLGGSDRWQALTLLELSQTFEDGLSADTYYCSSSSVCSWPLPRSRAQGWVLSGRVYLFSGMLSVVDQSFDNLRTQTLLLNDFWSFDPADVKDHPDAETDADASGAGSNIGGQMPAAQRVAMGRIAACSEVVNAPDILPADGGPYPGPRFSAALWTSTLDDRNEKANFNSADRYHRRGWLFGGIGRRTPANKCTERTLSRDEYVLPTDTRGFGNYAGASCVVDEIIGPSQYPVRNLCDLWVFVPGLGFRLVSACENDARDLSTYSRDPVPMVGLSEGPTAGIFATTWVTQSNGHLIDLAESGQVPGVPHTGIESESTSLWMFGGLTSCAPFDGVAADGRNASDPLVIGDVMDLPKTHAAFPDSCDDPDAAGFDSWLCHETELRGFWLENMTMCDMSLPGHGISVVGIGSGHPSHQPCTDDLWRFDLLTETWEHMHDLARTTENRSDGWPEARCGAVGLPSSSSSGSSSATQHSSMSFVGGWGGASSGECEEWPLATVNCSNNPNETSTTTRSAGCLHVLKSFHSKDLPTLPIRHSRAYVATCQPLSEVWNFGLSAAGGSAR